MQIPQHLLETDVGAAKATLVRLWHLSTIVDGHDEPFAHARPETIAKGIGLRPRSVRCHLATLTEAGLITRHAVAREGLLYDGWVLHSTAKAAA